MPASPLAHALSGWFWAEDASGFFLRHIGTMAARRYDWFMRIRFLLTQSLESPGGGGRYLPLAKALAKMGHQVRIIALHHDYETLRERSFVVEGVEVRYVGQMHVRKVGSRKIYYHPLRMVWVAARGTLALTIMALRDPGDALHVCKTQPMNGFAAWMVHLLRRTPVYLDSDDWETLNNRFQNGWQQRVVARFERWMPSFASGITTITTFIVEQYVAMGYPPERILKVPHGVDHNRFAVLERADLPQMLSRLREQIGIAPRHRVIVYIGSMSLVNHGLDLLLQAWAEVARAEPEALLVMVGGGEDLPELQQMAEELGVAGRVRWVGRVPLDEVPGYYCLGEFSVAPMRDTVLARSSLSIKVAESIVAGVPCLVADIGDYRATVGAAGLAVAPGSVQALADGILTLLRSPETLAEMRAAARKRRDEYTWDRLAERFAQIYEGRRASR